MKHSFSILLVLCVLMVVGGALVPQLDISNKPRPEQGKTLTISYRWKNASAKVVEQNVTSRIEALVSSVRGVEKVSSVSRFGSGRITVELKQKADVSATKFEIASILRQIRGKLPEGVSYPTVSGGEVSTVLGDDNEVKLILTYMLNADMSGEQMRQIAERETKHAVERIEGVHHVDITGTTAHYMEVEYDAEQLAVYGIGSSDIIDAIRNFSGREDIVGEISAEGGRVTIPLLLSSKEERRRFEQMPLKNIGGKIVYLNNLATCNIRERKPGSYYRVNGMNTIYVNVYADKDANVVSVSDRVKSVMEASATTLHPSLSYDRAEEQMKEFRTLVARSSLTLAILLVFVWMCGGFRWRYLAVISISLLANILIAVMFYRLADIRLHPFSMAGITVSLGIIIDSAIVMADHYAYYRDRRAFTGILAAMMTTVGALVIVFWLPDYLRHDLKDFSVVVMINLLVAVAVALFFTPALVAQFGVTRKKTFLKRNLHTRFVVWFSHLYSCYAGMGQRQWARCALLLVFAGMFAGSLKLFTESLDSNTFRQKEKETKLYVRAQMPLGGSVHELNGKVREVEALLSQFKEIKRFETVVHPNGAAIVIEFKDEALASGFPFLLESRVIGKVITIGGADWATSGVSERGFSNSLNLQYRANRIEIAGYDYERLYRFAEDMVEEMRKNRRVTDLAIVTPGHEEQEDEFFMAYDRGMMAADSVSAHDIHSSLQSLLADREAEKIDVGGKMMDVTVHPTAVNSFDLWQMENSYVAAGGRQVRPSGFMDISRRKAKNIIPRDNQEYVLRVAFNVLGSYTYTDRYIKSITEKFNSTFPVGFRCLDKTYGAYEDDGTQYWLIGLVA
ncbi:MAG: efflux RND transporter permease subunit, partial [Prevotella sp.]|nr:efflux RND transporter permease subunit [Prevotella sp.]